MRLIHPIFLLLTMVISWPPTWAGTIEQLTLEQILERAQRAEQTFGENLHDYICQATSTILEPQKDGTLQTIRVVEKTIYRKLPDQRLEKFKAITEKGTVLSPQEVMERHRRHKWQNPAAGRHFFGPHHRENYTYELMPPDTIRGLPTHVLRLIPRKREKHLVDGKIWLHGQNFEVVRLDFQPAQKPKFVKELDMIIEFDEVPPGYWLPAEIKINALAGFLFIKKHLFVHENWYDFQINVGLSDSLFVQAERRNLAIGRASVPLSQPTTEHPGGSSCD
jgi:hypothetical protein